MSSEGSNRDHANQIKQASDQPRGATRAGFDYPTHASITDILDRDGQRWKYWYVDEQLQTAGGLDTPTPPNESDALRRVRDR